MIPFTKMHGIGNDFVLVDLVEPGARPIQDPSTLARAVNDRRFGIGGDGLILVEPGATAPFRMRMFNPDGSEGEMCGNGVRCVARLLVEHGHAEGPDIALETGAGVLGMHLLGDGRVRVDMGRARLDPAEIGMLGTTAPFVDQPVAIGDRDLPGTAVGMGNPHLVLFVKSAMDVPLETWGPELEHHPLFPNRVNVHFVQVAGPGLLIQRTWERGAGATLACGTGACACAVAAAITGRAESVVQIRLPGGELEIEYAPTGTVWMTGPAETVFEGVWPG